MQSSSNAKIFARLHSKQNYVNVMEHKIKSGKFEFKNS